MSSHRARRFSPRRRLLLLLGLLWGGCSLILGDLPVPGAPDAEAVDLSMDQPPDPGLPDMAVPDASPDG